MMFKANSRIPMPEDIRRRVYDESEFDFSGCVCPDAGLADMDKAAVDVFRTKWIEKSGNKRLQSLSDEQILRDCGAITDKGITYAALIRSSRYLFLTTSITTPQNTPDSCRKC